MVRLTKEQIEEFYEVGYVVIPGLFIGVDLQRISRAIHGFVRTADLYRDSSDRFVYTAPPRSRLKRVVWAGTFEDRLLLASRTDRLLRPVSQLLGHRNLVQIINQVHLKWPNDHTFYPLHQDSSNRRYGTELWTDVNGKGSYVQCLTAVTEVTPSNGGLYFIPGSCKKGHLALPYKEGVETRTDDCRIEDAVPVILNPGDTVFFGPYTIHGSGGNSSSEIQKLFINGFALQGANRRGYPGCGLGEDIAL